MSLKEYEDLKKIRLEEGEKSRAHYKSVDLPGQRNKDTNDADSANAVKARIAAMKAEREDAGQA